MTPNEDILFAAPLIKGQVLHDHVRRVHTVATANSLRQKSMLILEKLPGPDGMPSGLGSYHQNLGHIYKSLNALVSEHTEENAFRCGMPPAKYEMLRARLVGRPQGRIRPSSLPVLFTVSERLYRQCPECGEEHIETYGYSPILLRNGLPFVSMCPIHAVELRSTADQALLFDQVCQEASNAYQRQRELEYSLKMCECLEVPAEFSIFCKRSIVEALTLGRWIGKSGRLNLAELLNAFTGFYVGSFSDVRLDILCTTQKYVENAIRALLREERALHPVWCVLLSWFAECCAFTAPIGRPNAAAEAKAQPSAEQVQAALAAHSSLIAAASALGVSSSALNCMCRRLGIPRVWRPKKIDASILQAIHLAYDEGLHPTEVMKRFKVSQSTAYRILATREERVLPMERRIQMRTIEARAIWGDALANQPTAGQKALRSKYGAAWAHLYRHDRDWLKEHRAISAVRRPNASRSRNSHLVARLNCAIKNSASRYVSEDKRPIYRSRYRMRLVLGINEFAFKSSVKRGFISNDVELKSAFVARRVRWAFKAKAIPSRKLSTIARALSLRPSTITKALAQKTKKEGNKLFGKCI